MDSGNGSGSYAERAPRVFNPSSTEGMFESGGVWLSRQKSNGRPFLKGVTIELKPGTYTFEAGDCLQLVGFENDKSENPKRPDFVLRVSQPKPEVEGA